MPITLQGRFIVSSFAPGYLAHKLAEIHIHGEPAILKHVDVAIAHDGESHEGDRDLTARDIRCLMNITTDTMRLSCYYQTPTYAVASFTVIGCSDHIELYASGDNKALDDALCAQVVTVLDLRPYTPGSSTVSARRASDAFHPLVEKYARQLLRDGHRRQAILDTFIGLITEVQHKSGRADLDGTTLMEQVFSPSKPRLLVSTVKDEQLGTMWLFDGAVMAIRNANAHRISPHPSLEETLEWLGFASALFRILDGAQVV